MLYTVIRYNDILFNVIRYSVIPYNVIRYNVILSPTSTARPNRHGPKTVLCVCRVQKGVIYYELLRPGEAVNSELYRQQTIDLNEALRENRPEYQKWQHKVILLYDNVPSHTANPV